MDSSDTREHVRRYFEATRSNDPEAWAGRFAPDATVDDPVGDTVTGTEAILERGRSFMSSFRSVGLTESYVFANGAKAVAKWSGEGVTSDGARATFEGINVFEFRDDGLIARLEGYWSPAAMVTTPA